MVVDSNKVVLKGQMLLLDPQFQGPAHDLRNMFLRSFSKVADPDVPESHSPFTTRMQLQGDNTFRRAGGRIGEIDHRYAV